MGPKFFSFDHQVPEDNLFHFGISGLDLESGNASKYIRAHIEYVNAAIVYAHIQAKNIK